MLPLTSRNGRLWKSFWPVSRWVAEWGFWWSARCWGLSPVSTSLFGCAASSNHPGQWCLTSPTERLRWWHNSFLFSFQGELVKGDDLRLGQRSPSEFKVTRNWRLQRESLHRIVHRSTFQGSLAQIYTIKFKMQSANTFLCGVAFHHSAPGLSCWHSGLRLCGCRTSRTSHCYWSPCKQLTIPVSNAGYFKLHFAAVINQRQISS